MLSCQSQIPEKSPTKCGKIARFVPGKLGLQAILEFSGVLPAPGFQGGIWRLAQHHFNWGSHLSTQHEKGWRAGGGVLCSCLVGYQQGVRGQACPTDVWPSLWPAADTVLEVSLLVNVIDLRCPKPAQHSFQQCIHYGPALMVWHTLPLRSHVK